LRARDSFTAVEKGEPDFFYLNRADGFMPVPWEGGTFLDEEGNALTAPPTDWGLSVIFRDFNGDGLPDLYVCNDYVYWPDRIWLNQNGKRFQAMARTAIRSTSLASMPVDVADINRDGLDDIFVADMLSPRREFRAWQRPDTLEGKVKWPVTDPNFRPEVTRNTLQLARGDGTFAEIAQLAGVSATDWTWGVAFLDVDLDGWEDLLLVNGHVFPEIDSLNIHIRYQQRAIFYRNAGGGKLLDMSESAGPAVLEKHSARVPIPSRHGPQSTLRPPDSSVNPTRGGAWSPRRARSSGFGLEGAPGRVTSSSFSSDWKEKAPGRRLCPEWVAR
jgi:hypothetical protein